jgi:flagellar hook assembly protein FlgD
VSTDLEILSLTLNPSSNFDPSDKGLNQLLAISYAVSPTPDSVNVRILNSKNDEIKNLSASGGATLPLYDGEYAGEIIEPGTYYVDFTAYKSGYSSVNRKLPFSAYYSNSNKASINNLSLSDSSFDPDFGDTTISFTNSKEADITVKVLDYAGYTVKTFYGYNGATFPASETHSIVWTGTNDSGNDLGNGNYTVKIIARNDYGVSVEERSVTLTDNGIFPSSNVHISNISLRPSTFNPAEDDDITIRFDVLKDLDELQIVAVRGDTEIEIFDESGMDEDDDIEVNWDGTDEDGDSLEEGTWRLEFRSELDSLELVCGRTIVFEYDKPEIDDFYLSKATFDNDIGEFTYVIFRIDADSLVDIDVLEDGDEEENITEEFSASKDEWYALSFDGAGFDYDDDLTIRIKAYNEASESVYSSKTIRVDLAEERSSSSKSNITEDYISPVLSDGTDTLELYYDIEDEADVVISLYKGSNASGTKVNELVNVKDQKAGNHKVSFLPETSSGSKLSKGVYTYKITSKTTNTDTETGLFVLGTVGEFDSAGGSTSDDDDDRYDGKVAPGVIIDGNYNGNNGGEDCGFSDVYEGSKYCEAILWAKENGVFSGYSDGTFRPYAPINRVELLKTIIESNGFYVSNDNSGNAGFTDVASGSWYIRYLKSGASLGIFNGDGGKALARPGDSVNRVEALKMALEARRILSGETVSYCSAPYNDVSSNSWYTNYVCESKNLRLFEAFGNFFYPSNSALRGEVAYMLYRLR